jgi:hypothetical protein
VLDAPHGAQWAGEASGVLHNSETSGGENSFAIMMRL